VKKLLLAILATCTGTIVLSQTAPCAPASAISSLNWNNVRALIHNNGLMWATIDGQNEYENPQGSGDYYSGSSHFWIGSKKPDGTLAVAASWWNGSDFWPGPLSTPDGSVSDEVCVEYDEIYRNHQHECQAHIQYHENLAQGINPETPYVMPASFHDWPAHGDVSIGQDYYLAPFYDFDGNGKYEPAKGDCPDFGFGEVPCAERNRASKVPLMGDLNLYWIMNDRGNVHHQSLGDPLSVEIHCQAFAWSGPSLDNITCYNYRFVNQGTQTLTEVAVGNYVDGTVIDGNNDYMGCDVSRGLQYFFDDVFPTGPTPSSSGLFPAFGCDIVQGLFQDEDEMDNPISNDIDEVLSQQGIPYHGLGFGYGDGIVDNERHGLYSSFFIYGYPPYEFPGSPSDFYNYLVGINGFGNCQEESFGFPLVENHECARYAFPGDSDPLFYGTDGNPISNWTEVTNQNPSNFRRAVLGNKPTTLEPGEVNNYTFAAINSFGTTTHAAIEKLRVDDDKLQALFDNCFEIAEAPNAPDLAIQELENELILTLSNDNPISNNHLGTRYDLEVFGFDPTIPEQIPGFFILDSLDRSYQFQGYLIYQLKDATIGATHLDDPDLARLIFQCDLDDGVSNIVNYVFDPEMQMAVPHLMVEGEDDGLKHSLTVTNDAFAQGDSRLVNHKTYYFMALAYAHNEYEHYDLEQGTGQAEPFLLSTRGATSSLRSVTGIPHKIDPENGGTILHTSYGDGFEITQLEGIGNGMNRLEITSESEEAILAGETTAVTYQAGFGPVDIKVVDPTRVPNAEFELRLAPDDAPYPLNMTPARDTVYWELTNLSTGEIRRSSRAFAVKSEELLLEWGISIDLTRYRAEDEEREWVKHFAELIDSEIEYEDPTRPWFQGVQDQEGFTELNWIRAGSQTSEELPQEIVFDDSEAGTFWDEAEMYESVLDGTWSPYCLTSYTEVVNINGSEITMVNVAPTIEGLNGDLSAPPNQYRSNIWGLNNVDVVFTSDKSLWTRCPVLEAQGIPELTDTGAGEKLKLRQHASVDKDGLTVSEGGDVSEAHLGGQTTGMSWFPGYTIDVGTGERLNMAFAEDSWLTLENGADMVWNPTHRLQNSTGTQIYAGGQHWIYVFKNLRSEQNLDNQMPAYDEGAFMHEMLEASFTTANRFRVFRSCTWVGSSLVNPDYPLLSAEEGIIANDCRIKLRVAKSYEKRSPVVQDVTDITLAENFWNPRYTFSTKGLAAEFNNSEHLASVLDCINVVPNPYFAYSDYETNKLDNRVKITNLPEVCTINIYTVSGTLVRQYHKADPTTSLDWDLKNRANVPIAGGVYLIHIDVPDVGERILKWFGVMRPVDLDNF
jgi:hypothetical protein